ncbi:MAG: ferritin family protein [Gammaproteobacteria bacterium]|nr:ferritin family protein [Gammaproteobacteria bacterium]
MTQQLFYINEVVSFAIEREKEAFALYEKLAEITTEPKLQKVFHNLMHQEKKHQDFYQHMLEHLKPKQTPTVHRTDEYAAYMQELISSARTVKPDLDKITANMDDAIVFAKAREQDSIIFYVNLKNFIDPRGHDKIDTIIAEEARHLAILTKLQQDLRH